MKRVQKLLVLPCLFFAILVSAQNKSYRLSVKGDTINKIDLNDLKQGRWVNKVESIRGEPGFEEEGVYVDGKKEGTWRVYTLMGDLLAVENYRWGNKDGKSQYFTMAGLLREESWKAVNPLNPYDTVDVFDPVDPNKVEQRVVKIEGTSVKHGAWKFYNSESGLIVKTENYFLDKLELPRPKYPDQVDNGDSAEIKTVKSTKVKPAEVLKFEKKVGKKKVKVLDGSTH